MGAQNSKQKNFSVSSKIQKVDPNLDNKLESVLKELKVTYEEKEMIANLPQNKKQQLLQNYEKRLNDLQIQLVQQSRSKEIIDLLERANTLNNFLTLKQFLSECQKSDFDSFYIHNGVYLLFQNLELIILQNNLNMELKIAIYEILAILIVKDEEAIKYILRSSLEIMLQSITTNNDYNIIYLFYILQLMIQQVFFQIRILKKYQIDYIRVFKNYKKAKNINSNFKFQAIFFKNQIIQLYYQKQYILLNFSLKIMIFI